MANINLPFEGEVTADNKAALKVTNVGTQGTGLYGESLEYQGVHGTSTKNAGVVGQSVQGWGVYGVSTKAAGVQGESVEGTGVAGVGKGNRAGVYGESTAADGVKGVSTNAAGVAGSSTNSYGIWGYSTGAAGVYGQSTDRRGVYGVSTKDAGVYGQSDEWYGVYGYSTTVGAVLAQGGKYALVAREGQLAVARFEGDVEVTGDIKMVNADCAEDFDISDLAGTVEEGTVMVLKEDGSLQPSNQEYDKKVTGIISGAGGYQPGIILNRRNIGYKITGENRKRLPIALMGKVYCRVDARKSPIEIGDLLTTSSTKGCAMKAEDPLKAFGAVIGKALGSIKEGTGMIPVLVALQ